MAETFRKGKIEDFVGRLVIRKAVLVNQLKQKEFEGTEQYIKGQISAIDTILQELGHEFDIDFPERIKPQE